MLSDILISKIIEYCIGYDKPNINVSKNVEFESGVSFRYIYNYQSTTTSLILSNLSRVNWKFFKIVSNNLNRIGYFLIENEEKRKVDDISYTPSSPEYSLYSPLYKEEIEKPKDKPKVDIVNLVTESNLSLLKEDIIPFSKFKLLNLNNVFEMDIYNSPFSMVLNNFKNLSTLITRFNFESDNGKDNLPPIQIKHLNIILKITFCKLYGIGKGIKSNSFKDNGIMEPFKNKDILLINQSIVKPDKMKYQLKFIQFVNPIYLNWNVDNSTYATDEPHLMFNNKFFKKCNRLKTIKIGNDFMDLSFINMVLESNSAIESLSCNILFHYIYYISNNPLFNPEPQLDYYRLSDLMPSHGTVKIPNKPTLCGTSFDSRKTYDSYQDFISQFSKLSSNIKSSKSLKTLKFYNYCITNLDECYIKNKQHHGCTSYTSTTTSTLDTNQSNIYFEFLNSIENNESISKLSFSNLQFQNETNQLIDCLINNKSIKKLSLKNGVLRGDKDIELILKLLSRNKRITKLNISNNNFKNLDLIIQILNNSIINHNIKIKLDNIICSNSNSNGNGNGNNYKPLYNSYSYSNNQEESLQTKYRLENEITNKFITIIPYKSTNDIYKMYSAKSFKNKEINL